MATVDTTTVVNTSGVKRTFEFLPPFGVTLAAGQEYTFSGTLTDGCRRWGGPIREALVTAMEYAMHPDRNWLAIKSTPTVVLHDEEAEQSVRLLVDDGKLYVQHADDVPVLIGPASGGGGGGGGD